MKNVFVKPIQKRQKQLSLFRPIAMEFGGSLQIGRRKSKRTLTTKKPIHMTIKGDPKNSGPLMKHEKVINQEIKRWASKFAIRVYDFGIEKNHIHFAMKISSRENYNKFIRALTSRIAQLLKFKFTLRPFTKILEWGKQFKNVLKYTIQNKEEALGIRPYKIRDQQQKQYLKNLKAWIEANA